MPEEHGAAQRRGVGNLKAGPGAEYRAARSKKLARAFSGEAVVQHESACTWLVVRREKGLKIAFTLHRA
jgi:hypothetical protein